MTPFRDLPITKKLRLVIILTSSVILLVGSIMFITYELVVVKQSAIRSYVSTTQMIGANCSGSLLFDVPEDAQDVLAAVRAEPSILFAAVYRTNGALFASFPATDPSLPLRLETLEPSLRVKGRELTVLQNIYDQRGRIGVCYLRASLADVYDRVNLYSFLTGLVLLGAFFAGFVVSRPFQASIVQPLLELAATARRVTEDRDYSVRARKHGNDEVGVLTDAFNQMLRQIHEREVALRESEERYRSLVSAMTSVVWTADAEGKFVTPQPSWEAYTGQTWKDYSGWGWLKAVHEEDRAGVERMWKAAVVSQKIYEADGRVWNNLAGYYSYFAARAVPLTNQDGTVREWVGTITDIDAQRKAEEKIHQLNAELEERVVQRTAQLAESNKELEAFTYSVSHDLRAPLRHIVGFGNLLKEEYGPRLPDGASEYLNRMIQGARNMGQLVDDLLNLARVGRQELNMQVANLNSILDELVRDFTMDQKDRVIRWKIEPLPLVECDPGLIKQVYANLLSNAVKYTRTRNEAVIEVGVLRQQSYPVFFVRDNGVGFSMKYVDKLFGVFQRLHRSEDFEGTGVGLATVHRIITKHGGRVWVEAELDKGATFYFTLHTEPGTADSTTSAPA
jgi:PAS domain S-box-containing protein